MIFEKKVSETVHYDEYLLPKDASLIFRYREHPICDSGRVIRTSLDNQHQFYKSKCVET